MFFSRLVFLDPRKTLQGALVALREANSELREAQADLRAYPAPRLGYEDLCFSIFIIYIYSLIFSYNLYNGHLVNMI